MIESTRTPHLHIIINSKTKLTTILDVFATSEGEVLNRLPITSDSAGALLLLKASKKYFEHRKLLLREEFWILSNTFMAVEDVQKKKGKFLFTPLSRADYQLF